MINLKDEAFKKIAVNYLNGLSDKCINKCKEKSWERDWSSGGCYMHLETSEFIESLRGKKGSPECEAADVLFCLLSILKNYNIPIENVLIQLENQLKLEKENE